jgi:predicted transcriptional regulator of viral defense system
MTDAMVTLRANDLPDALLARGQHWITLPEVAELLDVPREQVPPLMARLRKKGQIFSPTRSAYVPIPPEYRSWRAVPAAHFIDRLMVQLDHPYYVGLLSAAELHGAAHQRPQVFQVVTNVRVRNRSFGRVALEFVKNVTAADRPIVIMNTPTGTMRVATPEVTLLDLVASPRHGGGLSNVATVAAELVVLGRLDPEQLVRVAKMYSVAVIQRSGFILDYVAHMAEASIATDRLVEVAQKRTEPTPLDAGGARSGELDGRWNVLVNADIEPDL